MPTLANAAVRAISWYQSDLSPRKGFRCAHRVLTGDLSCSAFAKQAISERGLLVGLGLFASQVQRCHASAKALAQLPRQDAPDAPLADFNPSKSSSSIAESDFCVKWVAAEAAGQGVSCCLLALLC